MHFSLKFTRYAKICILKSNFKICYYLEYVFNLVCCKSSVYRKYVSYYDIRALVINHMLMHVVIILMLWYDGNYYWKSLAKYYVTYIIL